jgi:hypothetical protein
MPEPSELAAVAMDGVERLPFDEVREEYPDRWDRALESDAELTEGDRPGQYVVRLLPDGDGHNLAIAKTSGDDPEFFGWCSCQGNEHHSGPCAHLCWVRMDYAVGSTEIPAAPSTALESTTPDAEVVEPGESIDEDDDVQEEPVDEGPTTVSADEVVAVDEEAVAEDDVRASAPTPGADVPAPSGPQDGGDPFAQPLEGVDGKFAVELRGEPELRRAGYAAIARSAGFTVDVEAEVTPDDTDWRYARYRAHVYRDGEQVATDVGSALEECEDLEDARAHLDELASTRAIKRALEWATGSGTIVQVDEAGNRAVATDGGDPDA